MRTPHPIAAPPLAALAEPPGAAAAPRRALAEGPWQHELLRRMKRLLLLKTSGITAFMWIFFIAYFHELRHPGHPVTAMPLTALDRWIPFEPAALGAYVSLWLYVGIAPGLMPNFRQLVVFGLWAAALCTAGLACFHYWPTAVPAQLVNVGQHPGFALLQGVDAAGNACPSLHVATAMFSALWIHRLLQDIRMPAAFRAANLLWFFAIAWSTLAIKQHVVIDVLAGALLGAVFAAMSLRWRPAI